MYYILSAGMSLFYVIANRRKQTPSPHAHAFSSTFNCVRFDVVQLSYHCLLRFNGNALSRYYRHKIFEMQTILLNLAFNPHITIAGHLAMSEIEQMDAMQQRINMYSARLTAILLLRNNLHIRKSNTIAISWLYIE